ncbi:hypothetical protein WJX84_001910 [Apatococcus fuscideae]|uniref:Chalcone isomerase domain-containing protein n=1 Tax=Apatococcus fuscideae TaxID=2026836 RepID=A0AAW1SSU8_9CHLO
MCENGSKLTMFAVRDELSVLGVQNVQPRLLSLSDFEFVQKKHMTHGAHSCSPFASASAAGSQQILEPGLYCPDRTGSAPCPVLIGLGQRQKRLLGLKNVSVYAVGLYLDPSKARQLVQKQPGLSPAALDKLYGELIQETESQKTLRMVITFGKVNADNFYSALSERLKPQMKTPEDEAALEEFGSRFRGVKFYKGMPLAFTTAGHGKLTTRIDEKEVGTTISLGLTRALFNTYLGSNPVSQSAKDSIGQGLLQLAAQAQ